MKIDKTNVRQIIRDITDALASVENKYGLKISQSGSATYFENMLTLKLEACVINSDGTAYNRDAASYELLSNYYGLSNIPLGSTFPFNGSKYKIIGFRKRCKKQPVMCKQLGDDVRTYKFSVDTVKRLVNI